MRQISPGQRLNWKVLPGQRPNWKVSDENIMRQILPGQRHNRKVLPGQRLHWKDKDVIAGISFTHVVSQGGSQQSEALHVSAPIMKKKHANW